MPKKTQRGKKPMTIQIENRQKLVKINRRIIRTDMKRLLGLLNCADKEVCITFLDDAGIQLINKQYLFKDKPTNVISFSLREGEFGDINPDMLGDIIISVETAGRDAVRGHLSFEEEILYLMIHGLLHLLGYDHVNTSPANIRKMKRKEKELFSFFTRSDSV
jgi:probable rRNA maturation factor